MSEPRKPVSGHWICRGPIKTGQQGTVAAEYWQNLEHGALVISAVEMIGEAGDGKGGGPEWHLSLSLNGGRAPRWLARSVLRDFGASDFLEDNHVPNGFVRNFWKACDPHRVGPCACEEQEVPHVEGDFTWREERP